MLMLGEKRVEVNDYGYHVVMTNEVSVREVAEVVEE